MELVENPQIELAFDYVSLTNKHIFLTGKAGTGKTTFLRRVRQEVVKRMAVVAPTGVAAINAEGVTIHSLFQLPFGPIVPGQTNEQMSQRRFNRKKIDLIKSLDLLIIDEISMVRADVLDAIDAVLRRYRPNSEPFGGLQLLMIGDLHQLPPVVKNHEWDLLKGHYSTPYFFGSLALQKTDAITIELKHIYRQSDRSFIDLLSKVRDNNIDTEVLEELNSRYQPDFQPEDKDAYITLTAHNSTSRAINAEKLILLPGAAHKFTAKIEGDFPAHTYPTEEELSFKVDAQVMFVKNDFSEEKRYYNGKIGRITKIKGNDIHVLCPGDEDEIVVGQAEWHNRRYSLDDETKEVEEKLIGTFTQHPLKLAWAITIHKSQGLTFERVIIDAQAAFAHGQVYVALSRCKSFEGIVLRSKLLSQSVKTDAVVRNYSEEAKKNEPDQETLTDAKRAYQQGLLNDYFQFKTLRYRLNQFHRFIHENQPTLHGNVAGELKNILEMAQQKIFAVAQTFLVQLEGYFAEEALPEENEELQARLSKAGPYFVQRLHDSLLKNVKSFHLTTDNQAVAQKGKERKEDLKKELIICIACAQALTEGFDSQAFDRIKANADIDYKKTASTKSSGSTKIPKDVAHPELYQLLTTWRRDTADRMDVKSYQVLTTRSLIETVAVLPTNLPSLKRIHGIGKARAKQFGEEIMEIVAKYCGDHELEPNQFTHLKSTKPAKSTKPDSKAISLALFKSGKTIPEIVKERGFVETTIEGHLAHYVGKGELSVFDLISPQKVAEVSAYFENVKDVGLSTAKSHFGEAYSYGQLRMVREHWLKEKESQGN